MAPSYTTNSGIEKPLDGEQTGSWGDTVNLNMDIIDRSLTGVGSITLSGTTHTLTTTDGTLTDGQYRVLVLGGTPSGTNTITVSPNDQTKLYFVVNNSGQDAVFTQGSGGNVTVANNTNKMIYADGAGAGAAVVDFTDRFAASNIDINGGTIDGTVIGGSSAAAATVTTLTASGNSIDLSGTSPRFDWYETDASADNGKWRGIATGESWSLQAINDAESFSSNAIRISRTGTTIDSIEFSSSGSERMRIDSSGDVGIGTSSPSAKLDVNGSLSVGTNITSGSNTAETYISGGTATNSGGNLVLYPGSHPTDAGDVLFRSTSTTVLKYDNSATEWDFQANAITTTGTLSAADSTINGALTVTDSTGVYIELTDTATAPDASWRIYPQTGNTTRLLRFTDYNTGTPQDRMVIDGSGNVGIGTSSPSSYNASANNLVVYENGNGGITIASNTTSSGSIYFADGTAGSEPYRGVVQYNHASDYMRFLTQGIERVRITSLGTVGIGTSSPQGHLHVSGVGDQIIAIESTSTGGGANAGVKILSADGGDFLWQTGNSTGNALRLYDLNASAERMRIDSSGNVGIGTSSPSAKLDVTSGSTGEVARLVGNNSALHTLSLRVAAGEVGALEWDNGTTIGATNSIRLRADGDIKFESSGGTEYLSIAKTSGNATFAGDVNLSAASGTIDLANAGNRGIYYDGTLVNLFSTVAGGDVQLDATDQVRFKTASTERMRIDSSGNVGIGTTSPRALLHVSPPGGATDDFNVLVSQFRPNIVLEDLSTSAVDFQFFVDANALQFRYGDASTDTKLATEAMRLDSSGNVGIGTSSPATVLHTKAGSNTETDWIFTAQNNAGTAVTEIGGYGYNHNLYHKFWINDSEKMRLTDTGRLGLGTTAPSKALDIVAANNVGGLEVTVNDTVANQTFYANLIDYNLSGSDSTTTDRTHVGLRLDIDSSASGGNTSDEHRIYGIWNDIDVTADSDVIWGCYNSIRTTHSAGTISDMRAAYNVAEADGTGTVTNAYGSYNYALSGTTVSGLSNAYGTWSKYLKESADTSTVSSAYGVYAEVEIDAGTITNAYGVRSVIDRDGGTVSTGYLYFGDYQGTYASGTQWGVYLSGEDKNYFSNNVGIGNTSASYKLHVSGDIYATGNVTAYSSAVAKDDITTIPDALDLVEQLRGVSFKWKDSGKKAVGLIYEEVKEVIPELTSNEGDNPGVQYQNTVALLIEAVKSLSARVKELESK